MSNEVSCDGVARRVNGENPLDVLVGVSTPYGPLLTDDYGRPIRFAEYGDGPCRFGDHPIQVMKPYEWLADRVYVFDDEAVAPFKDDVARFVVEACRCFAFAASARPIPKKALVCSMYGLSEAPPTRRFWDHAPMSVGLRKP